MYYWTWNKVNFIEMKLYTHCNGAIYTGVDLQSLTNCSLIQMYIIHDISHCKVRRHAKSKKTDCVFPVYD